MNAPRRHRERPSRVRFDRREFAETLTTLRHQHGSSTRDVARRAGVAQSYVVALERARSRPTTVSPADPVTTGPIPTVDVVARLAWALDVPAARLLEAGLVDASRHVLFVVDVDRGGAGRSLLEAASEFADGSPEWVWVGSSADEVTHRRIALRRTESDAAPAPVYDPAQITDALRRELSTLATGTPHDADSPLGLVFAETSAAMAELDAPEAVLDFELRWSDVVDDAAAEAGVRVAWNVCVYELGALRSLDDPVGSATHLLRSHDTIWSAAGRRVDRGHAAAGAILAELKPPGTPAAAWRTTVRELVDDLGLCA